MLDLMKKALYTGLGLAFMTGEHLEKLAGELADLGSLTEKEARDLYDEMVRKSGEARKEARRQIDERVREMLKGMDVVTREDFDTLKGEVGALRSELEAHRAAAAAHTDEA